MTAVVDVQPDLPYLVNERSIYICCSGSMTTVDGPSSFTEEELEERQFLDNLKLSRVEKYRGGFIGRDGVYFRPVCLGHEKCVYGTCTEVVKARSLCDAHYMEFARLVQRKHKRGMILTPQNVIYVFVNSGKETHTRSTQSRIWQSASSTFGYQRREIALNCLYYSINMLRALTNQI